MFDRTFFVFLAIAIASAIAVWFVKGPESFWRALESDAFLLISIIPLLGAGFLIGGFIQVLVPNDLVARWLGENSGIRGIAVATVAGFLTPGGPMVSFPIVVGLASAGADIGALVAYLTSWSVLGLSRIIMWEMPFMGFEFASVRWTASLVLPFIAGYIARELQIRIRPAAEAGD
ncbi:MAG TPA: permease [Alphaproteobacteria bacterium]|jgi:uncharacterized membrane protein YraQ (UPF0718 family)|nr:permease [Alphaproteobacteria bacterium]